MTVHDRNRLMAKYETHDIYDIYDQIPLKVYSGLMVYTPLFRICGGKGIEPVGPEVGYQVTHLSTP